MNKLKVLVWNLQDLFIFLDKYQKEDLSSLSEAKWQILTASFIPNKELEKVRAITELIERTAPDICLFTEVGGLESLKNLNQYFLKNKYNVYCEKSNSDRGIDLGIMISKNVELNYETKLIKDQVFARGVYELTLKHPKKNIQFLLTHLKSKLSKDKDFEGKDQRAKEVKRLIGIYEKRNRKHKYPLFICGDLNGVIGYKGADPELSLFANQLGLKDALNILNRDFFECSTYLYYNEPGDILLMQLDYFLAHPSWSHLLSKNSCVLDFDGLKRETIPAERSVKLRQPSDHYPLYIELDLDKI